MTTELPDARRLVAELLKQDTGNAHPQWRVIITDSESPDGIAPVCPKTQDTDGLHVIADYPGGPIQDQDGVYDCCPWPQVETHSTLLASYVVALLNADAGATR
ncbi:hypothetical protein IFE09_27225 [Streptomyces microflavus]|nr:hypothetical protein [Streptomyces microflavus]QQZ56892.1 hypothetical protein IFE09_27225 [Streptomyces microflavus]